MDGNRRRASSSFSSAVVILSLARQLADRSGHRAGHTRALRDGGVEEVDSLVEIADRGEVDRDRVGELFARVDAVLEPGGQHPLRVDGGSLDRIGWSVGTEPVVDDEERLVGAASVRLAVELVDRGERERRLLRHRVGAEQPRVRAGVLLAHHDHAALLLGGLLVLGHHHAVERGPRVGSRLRGPHAVVETGVDRAPASGPSASRSPRSRE